MSPLERAIRRSIHSKRMNQHGGGHATGSGKRGIGAGDGSGSCMFHHSTGCFSYGLAADSGRYAHAGSGCGEANGAMIFHLPQYEVDVDLNKEIEELEQFSNNRRT